MLKRILGSIGIVCIGLVANGQDPSAVKPISLETVLKLSGTNNLKIAEVNAKYELAMAEHLAAKEWLYPTISPGFLMMSYDGNAQTTDGQFVEVEKNSVWAGASVTAQWDLGHATYQQMHAKQTVLTAGHARQAEKNKQSLKAIMTYFELGAEQSRYGSLKRLVVKSKDIVRQLEVQVTHGIAYKSDLLLAKASLNHLQIQLSQAKTDVQLASNNLVGLLNINENVLLICQDTVLIPLALVDTIPAKIEDAYKKRPEILWSQSQIEGLTIQRKTTTTGLLLPAINLGLNDGLFGPYFNPLSNRLSYYVGAKWTIPLGTLLIGGKRKAMDARINLAAITMEDAKNTIRKEVRDAQARAISSKAQLNLANEGLGYAKVAMDQSMQRQRLGTAIPLEVFNAQEQLLRSQLDQINAIRDYNKAQYQLYVALGNDL